MLGVLGEKSAFWSFKRWSKFDYMRQGLVNLSGHKFERASCLWHQNHLKSTDESLTLICSFRNTRSKNIKTVEPGSRCCTTENDSLWRFTYAFHIFRGSHSLQSVTPKQWNHSAGRICLWCYECYHLYFKPPWINKHQKAYCSFSFVLVMEGLYTEWTHIDLMTMTMTFKWFLFYMQCWTECQLYLTTHMTKQPLISNNCSRNGWEVLESPG